MITNMALTEVKRYNCEFCGKDFRTPDRHICKFDPKFKNCHSCTHCLGFEEQDRFGGIDVGEGIMPTDQLYAKCSFTEPEYGCRDMVENSYYMDCEHYEWCGGRWVDYMNDNHIDNENPLDDWPF